MTRHEPIVVRVRDFTETPGARTREDGPDSGAQFRDEILEPAFLQARKAKVKLLVDFDGTQGYATSFLEESFGGLARKYGKAEVTAILDFKCEDEPSLRSEILGYIEKASPATMTA